MRKKAYRATDVKNVELECLLSAAPEGPVWVGLDIGKFVIYVVIRWHNGHFERPWKVLNPSELELLAGILGKLGATRTMIVALESTGTYGDPLRARLAAHGLTVHRVGGKAASDYAEVFDGVPSQHDGKDAAILAELAAFGKSQPWPYRELSASDSDLTYWVNWLDAQQSVRKWLYFAAMRQVKTGPVRRWHEAKKARDKDRGLGSLIAVARKLALALHVVAVKGVPFEPWRLFPGRSLARRNLQTSSVEPVGA